MQPVHSSFRDSSFHSDFASLMCSCHSGSMDLMCTNYTYIKQAIFKGSAIQEQPCGKGCCKGMNIGSYFKQQGKYMSYYMAPFNV